MIACACFSPLEMLVIVNFGIYRNQISKTRIENFNKIKSTDRTDLMAVLS
jgi:hypothetical protein